MSDNAAVLAPTYLAMGDLERELATTRRMLERAPEEFFSWKPHEKSMSLGELVAHLSHLLWWNAITLTEDELDMSKPFPKPVIPDSTEALLRDFDEKADVLRQIVANFDIADMARDWTLRAGPQIFLQLPKADVYRMYCVSHMAHHRGQLSVYLRLLDVPVPPSYGPTADEGHA